MSGRAAVDRWRAAAEVLAEVRREPGITRVELARRLSLASGSATEITTRLRELGWVAESRAPATGRGRPTTALGPAPDGPCVVAVDLRYEGWRCAVTGLDGRPGPVRSGRYRRRDPDDVVAGLATVVGEMEAQAPGPVVAVGIAVAATVATGDPRPTDRVWLPSDPQLLTDAFDVPVSLGNDATLAGVAEVRTGAAVGAGTAVFVTVEVGIGGVLVVDGRPLAGARGASGEFGHLPFGDPDVVCACGARGCWGTGVGAGVFARLLGEPDADDPSGHALAVLERAGRDPDARAAAEDVASRLGRGAAGLVNAHDPDVLVIGGLGPAMRAAAPDAFGVAYGAGLMSMHREPGVPVRDAVHGPDAPLVGAAAVALDGATSAAGLATFDESRQSVS
ncbi:ROK family transcriptional regulator [Pseudonocardia endophytica]|uniref:Putative NBD/HSP70 family sugar kinase n=1 Tax=Pseudonocardia endophytica TaxID=401976 RepID=A0A4R1I7R8_PSEEN|nr:ROK family transcriptional regulator [Pseudonocardia endophytica]TCK26172.1 putative NBD/HSP70 family sugar kinase [Pseudonocardia endophytica]